MKTAAAETTTAKTAAVETTSAKPAARGSPVGHGRDHRSGNDCDNNFPEHENLQDRANPPGMSLKPTTETWFQKTRGPRSEDQN